MARFLYKYGAIFLWLIIVAVYILTQNIWFSLSALIIGLTIGFTYDDIYNEYIHTSKQKRYLVENAIGLLILAIVVSTSNIWLISITVILGIGLHLLRNHIIN